jgi:hypothetical protein
MLLTRLLLTPGNRPLRQIQPIKRRARNQNVLFNASPAGANASNYHVVGLNGNATAENDHPTMVSGVDAKALLAALSQLRERVGWHIECSRCPCLVDRDVNAAEPGSVHSHVRDQSPAGIYDRNVIGDRELGGLQFARGNCASGFLKR